MLATADDPSTMLIDSTRSFCDFPPYFFPFPVLLFLLLLSILPLLLGRLLCCPAAPRRISKDTWHAARARMHTQVSTHAHTHLHKCLRTEKEAATCTARRLLQIVMAYVVMACVAMACKAMQTEKEGATGKSRRLFDYHDASQPTCKGGEAEANSEHGGALGYASTRTSANTSIHVCTHVCTHVYMHAHTHVCAHACAHACHRDFVLLGTHVHTHVRACACTCIIYKHRVLLRRVGTMTV